MANVIRFSEIDDSNRDDHTFLDEDDECLYLFEYTSGQNYQYSVTNNLISNLKKKPTRRHNANEYRHKLAAIRDCSIYLSRALNHAWLRTATLVPVPPSKAKDDPDYCDRMLQICRGMPADFQIDVRELVTQKENMRAAHESTGNRPSIRELVDNYQINAAVAAPAPTTIAIVDDVLTVGTHFKAMQRVLSARFPDCPILGIFIARRVFANAFDVD